MSLVNLPIIVEDELFLYPFMITPIFLSDEKNIKALDLAIKDSTSVMVVCSKPSKDGERDFDSIYEFGVVGNVMRRVAMPDGRVKILFQGLNIGKIVMPIDIDPLTAKVQSVNLDDYDINRVKASLGVLKESVKNLSLLNHFFPPDLLRTIDDSNEANRVCDLVCSALHLKKDIAYKFFIEMNLEKKILDIIEYVNTQIETNKLQKEIKTKVTSKIDRANKEYFLKEQLKEIQRELGIDLDKEAQIAQYKNRLKSKQKFMSEDAYKEIDKNITKLSKLHADSAESSMTTSYLDWVLDIPFGNFSTKNLTVKDVQKELDSDHFGLEKPKRRIVEYFGLKELLHSRGLEDNNGAILCFVGPPGIGKTSLANSISNALKRELVRIALGGLEDVNELRGHRRTYIGAMPGRIVQGLIEAKSMNPVVVLDEIDKIARSYKGDPTAVLLEILDPEQNSKFRDYYLNFHIDLSKVIFIATANDASAIPAPLRDRMEFIWLNSYTPQEKFEIAKRYLWPNELKKHGLKSSEVTIKKDALNLLISDYTRESGVRNLRHRIADILRKSALEILNNTTQKVSITTKNLENYLDKKVFEIEIVGNKNEIGIANGLAWTAVGGDVLKIEAIKIKGKGAMQITGQLGDVMKESATIAFSLVKSLIDRGEIKIPKNLIQKDDKDKEKAVYDSYDLHIHVPEGATPKDGPSAGITMTTVIASILSDTPIYSDVAMTGEITLSGKVLPIGGLKEKLIAAYKAGVKRAIIPSKNYDRDLKDIPQQVIDNMDIIPVDTILDVLKIALVK
ncbi:endopeptidase La [Campylobacter porcelli]|uniref:Lon protease n=1 Tax=Campylobacter porcelli TaxID=1660073 RepID=A0A1X9SWH7_9BACT|nr:endopeptidase La [Campylobacter sp. RM6137]ARR00637.1 DNA-binding, ATP-dependent protease La [Campylobacter sp. RM6137]MEE3704176.1 endopeptidase La [Campylobacter sp. CX2-8023-23]MEE3743823.1 endopeptidase La [Campylobacter sp. CX2-4855-23]